MATLESIIPISQSMRDRIAAGLTRYYKETYRYRGVVLKRQVTKDIEKIVAYNDIDPRQWDATFGLSQLFYWRGTPEGHDYWNARSKYVESATN